MENSMRAECYTRAYDSLWLPSSVMQATWNLLLELPNPSSAPDFRIHYRVQNPTLAEHEA